MNIDKLFATLRELDPNGKLSQSQVDSVNAILENCTKYAVIDHRQIAYIMATCWHESRLKPIEENGKGRGLPYGGKLDIGGGPGKRVAYSVPDKLFYGRGLVQITWLSNYKAFAKIVGVDLVNHPEFALQTDVAAQIAVYGMKKGMFTGRYLAQFFNDKLSDAVEARTIINGHDQAVLIAGYYNKILIALNS